MSDDGCPKNATTILGCLCVAHEVAWSLDGAERETLFELSYHIECALIAAARLRAEMETTQEQTSDVYN